MALKTRRQSRYEQMRKMGLLPFEARPLSLTVPLNVPYVRSLLMDRANDARAARARGVTRAEFEEKIKGQYKREGWLKKDRQGRIVGDPWKMLRDYEDRFRARNPEYESPWEPRGKKLRDFIAKLERTRQRQMEVA